MMKKIVFYILFAMSSTIYGQDIIENDSLYQEYEAEYIKYIGEISSSTVNLDQITGEFYSKFTSDKALTSFNKSKNKVKWLTKNAKKNAFLDADEAVFLYTSMNEMEVYQKEKGKRLNQLLNELKKKYKREVIYNTLKSRLQK